LLSQVVSNLAGNAIQHGGAVPRLHLQIDGTAAERVILRVRNAGAIERSVLPNMFDAFRRGCDRPSKGLGLGLFITKHVVTAHGGTVGVEATEDTTTFTVDLPRAAPRLVAVASLTAPAGA
jgi:signal transduction histidine kinase